jgi:hypothetical protein
VRGKGRERGWLAWGGAKHGLEGAKETVLAERKGAFILHRKTSLVLRKGERKEEGQFWISEGCLEEAGQAHSVWLSRAEVLALGNFFFFKTGSHCCPGWPQTPGLK